ncbi:hypothetical protein DM860_010291 [Cuscuta australis]|uniref:Uncharacterized protein n=1 Tax=Cuscuta australis TaxID=267555 RepID=A0A328D6R6_9ASTE|nr:hypothetical protein DM860_010291 [Cuscuta australis]
MKHSILRSVSLCTRNLRPFFHTSQTPKSSRSILLNNRFFASGNPNPNRPIPGSNPEQLDSVAVLNTVKDSQDLSNEALKKKIERLAEGDGEAIPEIFEAILKRKLSGKSAEEDEELMKDIRSNPKFDQDFDESYLNHSSKEDDNDDDDDDDDEFDDSEDFEEDESD